MSDIIKIEILPGGIIKTTTDPISGPNHHNAEGFLQSISELAGGNTTVESKAGSGQTHTHQHGTTHTH